MEIKPKGGSPWDLVSLGEVMLRLDPGHGRIATTRAFQVWEGGGEYNVARGLRRCFGMRTAIVTALADNPIGRFVEDFMNQGGVRAALGCSDRLASGLIYGFLANRGPKWVVERGAAHGALAMTTPGDTTMATLSEVERVMKGFNARVAP